MIKESVGSRGKTAEKMVWDALKRLNVKQSVAFFRLADARAAAGALASQPGDFVFFSDGRGGILEVKSTQHPYRLPKGSVPQLPVLKMLSMAGAQSYVIVLHKGDARWRVVSDRDLKIGVPSWDLRHFPTFATADEALLSTGAF